MTKRTAVTLKAISLQYWSMFGVRKVGVSKISVRTSELTIFITMYFKISWSFLRWERHWACWNWRKRRRGRGTGRKGWRQSTSGTERRSRSPTQPCLVSVKWVKYVWNYFYILQRLKRQSMTAKGVASVAVTGSSAAGIGPQSRQSSTATTSTLPSITTPSTTTSLPPATVSFAADAPAMRSRTSSSSDNSKERGAAPIFYHEQFCLLIFGVSNNSAIDIRWYEILSCIELAILPLFAASQEQMGGCLLRVLFNV